MFTLGFHLDRFIKLLPLYQVGELPLPHCAPIIFPIDKPPFFMAKPPFFYGKTIIFHHETTIFLWRFCHVSPQTVPNLRDTPPGPSLAAEWRLTSRRSRHCWGRNLAKRSASRAISPGSDAIFEPFGYSMYPIRFTCVYIYIIYVYDTWYMMYMIYDIWYMIHDIWYMIYDIYIYYSDQTTHMTSYRGTWKTTHIFYNWFYNILYIYENIWVIMRDRKYSHSNFSNMSFKSHPQPASPPPVTALRLMGSWITSHAQTVKIA